MKVPLGPEFDKHIEPEDRFTVQDAMKMAHDMLKGVPVRVPDPESAEGFKEMPAECSMVIDLTNSSRYYRRETFEDAKFKHVKVYTQLDGEKQSIII